MGEDLVQNAYSFTGVLEQEKVQHRKEKLSWVTYIVSLGKPRFAFSYP